MIWAFLALIAGRAAAEGGKSCLSDWSRDVTDSCDLYAELLQCQAKLDMCSKKIVVHIADVDGTVTAHLLADATYAELDKAAQSVGIPADYKLTMTYAYAGTSITMEVDDDASFHLALALEKEAILKATYVPEHGWIKKGTLKDWDTVVGKYKPAEYEYGVIYNHGGSLYVHKVVPSGWNRGIRLTTEPYMQNDNIADFDYGVATFYRGLDDQTGSGSDSKTTKTQWAHRYYQLENGAYSQKWTNGNADSIGLYVKQRPNAWERVGTMADWDNVLKSNPPSRFRYGTIYNHGGSAYIHPVVASGWNRGIRLTAENYMMGDNGKSMSYGMAVFARGTDGQAHTWQHYYYRLTGGTYVKWSSNGNAATVQLWAQKL